MALVTIPQSLMFPNWNIDTWEAGIGNSLVDATDERIAHMGQLYIEGRAASKTLSAAGGGSIAFRAGAVTFANAGTTLRIGIQDVNAAAGPQIRPDGTFDVSVDLIGGGGGLTANAWNTISLTGGTGSKTMNHGDMVAVVWDMTARAGADLVNISNLSADTSGGGTTNHRSAINIFTGGAWGAGNGALANAVIHFDDGTLGYIIGAIPFSAGTNVTFSDASNPDEHGLRFQVPFPCQLDQLCARLTLANDAAADFTIGLYEDPTGTPVLLSSLAVLAEQWGRVDISLQRWTKFQVPAVDLEVGVDYGVTIKATGTANVSLNRFTLGNTNYRNFVNGGSTLALLTRNGGSGAFTAESPALILPLMSVGLSAFDSGGGGGGGFAKIIGPGGLIG